MNHRASAYENQYYRNRIDVCWVLVAYTHSKEWSGWDPHNKGANGTVYTATVMLHEDRNSLKWVLTIGYYRGNWPATQIFERPRRST